MDASTTVLKAALECEVDCAGLLVGAQGPLQGLIGLRDDPDVSVVLQRHRLAILERPTPERRLVEAGRLAERGTAIAVVGTDEVPRACMAIAAGGDAARRGVVVLAIDDPVRFPGIPVRRYFSDLDLPVLEPGNLEEVRSSIEHAAMLADALGGTVVLVVDEHLLRTGTTLTLRANRVVETRDAAAALRRRRIARGFGDSDLIQIIRRLGLDQSMAMPSPGEREVLGIVATGIASTSVRHLLEELRLTGRVPAVFAGVVHPIDRAPIERLVRRCRKVVVLENRPGLLAPLVLEIADRIRSEGDDAAEIAWREIPTPEPSRLDRGDGAQPSVIARRLLPLLQEIRPGLAIDHRLGTGNIGTDIELPPRSIRGERGGMSVIRRAAISADRSLRRGLEDAEPIALSINGRGQSGFTGRVVDVEIVDRSRLLEEAVPLLALRDARTPGIVIVADGEQGGLDASRILDAAIPAGGETTPKVQVLDSTGENMVRDAIVLAARSVRPTILVVRHREPLRDESTELDRLGYSPVVRVRTQVEDICGVRSRETPRIDETIPSLQDVRSSVRIERAGRRLQGRWVARLGHLVEIAEIVRQRAPLPPTTVAGVAISPPPPRHRGQGRWRAHVAGIRGVTPGAASSLLVCAGRGMGFDVRVMTGPGAPAGVETGWAQVLFTRPARAEVADSLVPQIPYGEADLILGVDPQEAVRAMGLDPKLRVCTAGRTTIVADRVGMTARRSRKDGEPLEALDVAASKACGTPDDLVVEIGARVRAQFGHDRLLDVVLLGMAFQRGLIPVGTDAMLDAAATMERRGFGRTQEALRFGRVLVEDLVPMQGSGDASPLERRRREIVLETRIHRGRTSAAWLDRCIGRTLSRLPGLQESEAGRRSIDDLLLALGRLFRRGGRPLVTRYVERLLQIYAADRGDTGRELTRHGILVLAEAMLPRDIFSLAIAATGLDHQRRLRRRFAVRRARGDRVERVYLARFDLVGFDRLARVDLSVGESLLAVVARLGRMIPARFRGDASGRLRGREIERSFEIAVLEISDPARYEYWSTVLRIWSRLAIDGRLHTMPPAFFAADADPASARIGG